MLRSNLILYVYSQGRSRCFLYISKKGLYTLWGSTVCIHCLFSLPCCCCFCACVSVFFQTSEQGLFGAGNFFWTRQMAWAISRTVLDFSFLENCPPEF